MGKLEATRSVLRNGPPKVLQDEGVTTSGEASNEEEQQQSKNSTTQVVLPYLVMGMCPVETLQLMHGGSIHQS